MDNQGRIIMKQFSITLLLASALLCAPFAAAQESSVWAEGGLQKVQVQGLDVVYAKPGATLAGYTKVMLAPVSVSFHKDWASTVKVGTNRQISSSDQQRIREKLAKLVQEELVKELNAGGYQLVTAPGDDVLGVEAAIVNLYVRAPANLSGQSGKDFYAVTAGEMSLVIQLTDSASGDAIARAFDNFKATEYTNPERITRADNEAEARSAASQWAKRLRMALDKAKGINAK
jgi:hypothetical protein